MKTNYTNSQKKLFEDYSSKSTASLTEILENRHKYVANLVEVVIDILTERGALPLNYTQQTETTVLQDQATENKLVEDEYTAPTLSISEINIKENSFFERMNNINNEQLLDIIKTGSDFQLKAVEAAIYVAVSRNLISNSDGDEILGTTTRSINKKAKDKETEAVENRKNGQVEMITGLIISGIGGVITWYSYTNAVEEGGSYYVLYGAILSGIVLFFRGLLK